MPVLEEFAATFVDELQNGQRGVYTRFGRRWGVEWPTARSRVIAAVRRKRSRVDPIRPRP